ncbi:hypothetical protein [Granulicella sp. L60]|uniref:hypothetical protein n=1 Tax=Granulicella sp. L60 TaxID=1641866 RepID=UPI00131D8A39|nr:hypothetical protein [Granulicella sp. L60]
MAGRKLFTNQSILTMAVTLVIRAGDDPHNQAGTKSFTLPPGQSQWQEYGDYSNIYLNGIKLAGVQNGDLTNVQYIVILRGSPLDNQLNTRNGVDFTFSNNNFAISTRQVH